MPVQLIPARPPAPPPDRAGHASRAAVAQSARPPADRRLQGRPVARDRPPPHRAAPESRGAYPFIDRVRGIAAVVIMLHHLLGYVPSAARGLPLPAIVNDAVWWYGGLAAQVFLVVGGFVASLSLARLPPRPAGLGRFLLARYLRLAVPAMAALASAIALERLVPRSWAAFPLFDHFSWPSVLAHALLVQDVFGYPSLLTGFWYLPVDWQCSGLLAAVFAAHAAILRKHALPSPAARAAVLMALALPGALCSLFVWNGAAAHEPFATHYFGIVFLGCLAALAAVGRIPPAVFWAYAAACAAAAVCRGRPQIAVALAAAVAFHVAARRGTAAPGSPTLLDRLGRVSYSLFLIHYPTIWGVMSLGRGAVGDDAAALAPWVVATLPASLGAAVVLHRCAELPAMALAARLKDRAPASPGQATVRGADAEPVPATAR